jgi:hypothetical protein
MQSVAMAPVPCKAARLFRKVNRRVFCRHYDSCLDYAVEKNWSGFSCEACNSYEFLPGDMAQNDDDYTVCLPGMAEVEFV